MEFQAMFAFMLYALVSSITPGPNNLMVLSSGLNFGLRATLPHLLGIELGFMFMLAMVGLGLGQVFAHWPVLYSVLKYLGAAYLLYLAYGIANAGAPSAKPQAARPMAFWNAVAFQWVNPKAWIMAIGTFSTYVPTQQGVWVILWSVLLFGLVGFPSVGVWALFGARLRHYLAQARYVRWFNWTMAASLVLSLYPVLFAN